MELWFSMDSTVLGQISFVVQTTYNRGPFMLHVSPRMPLHKKGVLKEYITVHVHGRVKPISVVIVLE